jgi:hypothetical protein
MTKALIYLLATVGVIMLLQRIPGWAADSAPTPKAPTESSGAADHGLWSIYEQSLGNAKYIDLTHTLSPSIPVWQGFDRSRFGPALNPKTGEPYRYERDGFEVTRYEIGTDQLGTQLDPPAHWAPEDPAIDELPATYALRPLVVIPIVRQVARDPGYHLQVSDIERWEGSRRGRWSWCARTGPGSGLIRRSQRVRSSRAYHWRRCSSCTSSAISFSMVTSRWIPT